VVLDRDHLPTILTFALGYLVSEHRRRDDMLDASRARHEEAIQPPAGPPHSRDDRTDHGAMAGLVGRRGRTGPRNRIITTMVPLLHPWGRSGQL